ECKAAARRKSRVIHYSIPNSYELPAVTGGRGRSGNPPQDPFIQQRIRHGY
ncbi:MAG: hypothetical protein QOE94_1426, partial [Mycobacterium sp.]|nr:hypothetical protein [Mycobacterium sp.]